MEKGVGGGKEEVVKADGGQTEETGLVIKSTKKEKSSLLHPWIVPNI